MNGKCRRVKGCWSRGIPRNNLFFNNNSINNQQHNYFSLKFNDSLKKLLNIDQRNLLNHFENFPYIKKYERFVFDNNTPYSIVHLFNSDFQNGTLRIKNLVFIDFKKTLFLIQMNRMISLRQMNKFLLGCILKICQVLII